MHKKNTIWKNVKVRGKLFSMRFSSLFEGSSYCIVTLILLDFSFKLNFSFYKQCFDASLQEIESEVIWNNTLLCINKKIRYCRSRDFYNICDLFSTEKFSIPSKVSSLWVLLTLCLPVGA